MTHPHPVLLQRQGLGREEVDVPFRYDSEGMQRLGLVLQVANVFHLVGKPKEPHNKKGAFDFEALSGLTIKTAPKTTSEFRSNLRDQSI